MRIKVSSYLLAWSAKHNRLEKDLHTLYGDAIALVIAGRYVTSGLRRVSLS